MIFYLVKMVRMGAWTIKNDFKVPLLQWHVVGTYFMKTRFCFNIVAIGKRAKVMEESGQDQEQLLHFSACYSTPYEW